MNKPKVTMFLKEISRVCDSTEVISPRLGPTYDSIQSLNPDSESDQVLQGLYMPTLYLSHRFLHSLPVRGQPSLALVAW